MYTPDATHMLPVSIHVQRAIATMKLVVVVRPTNFQLAKGKLFKGFPFFSLDLLESPLLIGLCCGEPYLSERVCTSYYREQGSIKSLIKVVQGCLKLIK